MDGRARIAKTAGAAMPRQTNNSRLPPLRREHSSIHARLLLSAPAPALAPPPSSPPPASAYTLPLHRPSLGCISSTSAVCRRFTPRTPAQHPAACSSTANVRYPTVPPCRRPRTLAGCVWPGCPQTPAAAAKRPSTPTRQHSGGCASSPRRHWD
jgi:hypothetical protein